MKARVPVVDVRDLTVDAAVDAFIDRLGGPTVVRVPGVDRERLRVLSGTIHGNEPSGVRALHRLLVDAVTPATDVLLVFGALDATLHPPRSTHRMVPGRRDLNRCFRGPFDDDNGQIARAILDACGERRIEASVDIHNTTGKNPDFVIAGVIDDAHAGLASLFSERYLAWRLQLGTFAEVLDDGGAVGITFECGQVNDPAADARAVEGARRFVTTDVLPVGGAPLHLYRDPVRVRLSPGTTISFDDDDNNNSDADLRCPATTDARNFTRVEAGTVLGRVRAGIPWPLRVDGDDDRSGPDLSQRFFAIEHGHLVTRVAIVPLMITTNAAVAASDCLFYAVTPDGREGA